MNWLHGASIGVVRMDKLNEYRDLVKRVLNSYHELNIRGSDTKNESALVGASEPVALFVFQFIHVFIYKL